MVTISQSKTYLESTVIFGSLCQPILGVLGEIFAYLMTNELIDRQYPVPNIPSCFLFFFFTNVFSFSSIQQSLVTVLAHMSLPNGVCNNILHKKFNDIVLDALFLYIETYINLNKQPFTWHSWCRLWNIYTIIVYTLYRIFYFVKKIDTNFTSFIIDIFI